MKILFTYLLSLFSVAAFLGVTSGFTVYTHYCADTEVIAHGLIKSQVKCKHLTRDLNHEIHDVLSDCTSGCQLESNLNECCTDNKQFYKISNEFYISSPPEEELWKHSYTVISVFVLLNLELEDSNKQPVFTYSLPPLLTGKQIVVLYHQMKIHPDPTA